MKKKKKNGELGYLYLNKYLGIYLTIILRRRAGYLVNKPLSAAGVSDDNAQILKDCRKNEQLAEKRSFEGNCEILLTIFQPRALSSDKPASRKEVYLFYNPPNNFSRRTLVDRFPILYPMRARRNYSVGYKRGYPPSDLSPIYQQAEKRFIYFITLRIISQGERM